MKNKEDQQEIRFNESFTEFFKSELRYAILWGGAGSGKSYAIAQKIITRIIRPNEKHRILMVRKFPDTLEKLSSLGNQAA